jgi:hypothetical protein
MTDTTTTATPASPVEQPPGAVRLHPKVPSGSKTHFTSAITQLFDWRLRER